MGFVVLRLAVLGLAVLGLNGGQFDLHRDLQGAFLDSAREQDLDRSRLFIFLRRAINRPDRGGVAAARDDNAGDVGRSIGLCSDDEVDGGDLAGAEDVASPLTGTCNIFQLTGLGRYVLAAAFRGDRQLGGVPSANADADEVEADLIRLDLRGRESASGIQRHAGEVPSRRGRDIDRERCAEQRQRDRGRCRGSNRRGCQARRRW